jgi:hypothetical protein
MEKSIKLSIVNVDPSHNLKTRPGRSEYTAGFEYYPYVINNKIIMVFIGSSNNASHDLQRCIR